MEKVYKGPVLKNWTSVYFPRAEYSSRLQNRPRKKVMRSNGNVNGSVVLLTCIMDVIRLEVYQSLCDCVHFINMLKIEWLLIQHVGDWWPSDVFRNFIETSITSIQSGHSPSIIVYWVCKYFDMLFSDFTVDLCMTSYSIESMNGKVVADCTSIHMISSFQ